MATTMTTTAIHSTLTPTAIPIMAVLPAPLPETHAVGRTVELLQLQA